MLRGAKFRSYLVGKPHSLTIARIIAAASGFILIIVAVGLIAGSHVSNDRTLAASRTSQNPTKSLISPSTSNATASTTTSSIPTATTEPVVANGQLQSGTYYDQFEIVPGSPPPSSYPHYTVTLSVISTGSIQGELTMHYQDGSTRHVFSFTGSANGATGTIDIVTVPPGPDMTPGNIPESSLVVGSKISATFNSGGITFTNCASYLHWVSWALTNVSPTAINPNSCTFVPLPAL